MNVLRTVLRDAKQEILAAYGGLLEEGVPTTSASAARVLDAWYKALDRDESMDSGLSIGDGLASTRALSLLSASTLSTLYAAVLQVTARRGAMPSADASAQFARLLVASLKQLEALHVSASTALVGARLERVLEMSELGWYDYALGSNVVRVGGKMGREWQLPATTDLATLFSRIHPDDRAAVQKCGEVAIEGQQEFCHQYRIVVAGDEEWVEARGRVLQDEGGGAPRFVGTVRIITAHKALHAKIENERAWLTMALDKLPTPVVVLEPGTGKHILCNEAATDLLGKEWIQLDDSCDKSTLYDLRDRDGVRLQAHEFPSARALRGETLAGYEVTFRRPTGARELSFYSARIDKMPGHASTLICLLQDVTALKVHQRQLAALVDQLLTGHDARDSHLRTLLHDVRTPLSAASLAAQGAARSLARDISRVAPQLERVRGNLQRLDDMLERLLDNSRAQAGTDMPIRRQKASLGQALAEGVAELNAVHAGRIVFHDEVGAALLLCDHEALRRVLDNLVNNAVKYGHADAPITVRLSGHQGRVSLTVHNLGPQIEQRDRESLFLPFYRTAEAEGGSERGHGLGLATVQSIARAHGGTVFLSSSESDGTTFDVSFPATLGDTPATSGGDGGSQQPPSPHHRGAEGAFNSER